jgi:hypothetical protein
VECKDYHCIVVCKGALVTRFFQIWILRKGYYRTGNSGSLINVAVGRAIFGLVLYSLVTNYDFGSPSSVGLSLITLKIRELFTI